jgi:hypothetical protein
MKERRHYSFTQGTNGTATDYLTICCGYFALHGASVDSAGELKSAEIFASHMPSWKAKKFGETSSRNPVLEHLEVGSPAESVLV